MEKNKKIILGIIIAIIAIFAVIGGMIVLYDATHITVDDVKNTEIQQNETVKNSTVENNTTTNENEYKENIKTMKSAGPEVNKALEKYKKSIK